MGRHPCWERCREPWPARAAPVQGRYRSPRLHSRQQGHDASRLRARSRVHGQHRCRMSRARRASVRRRSARFSCAISSPGIAADGSTARSRWRSPTRGRWRGGGGVSRHDQDRHHPSRLRRRHVRELPRCLKGSVTATVARRGLPGKMADDDLVCPPPVSARDHPARRLALCTFHAQLSRRRRSAR